MKSPGALLDPGGTTRAAIRSGHGLRVVTMTHNVRRCQTVRGADNPTSALRPWNSHAVSVVPPDIADPKLAGCVKRGTIRQPYLTTGLATPAVQYAQ